MGKVVIFSSGFPSVPLPSTLAEPAALTKMRTISQHKPGPWGLSFFSRAMLKSLPASTCRKGLESRSTEIQLSSWELTDEPGKELLYGDLLPSARPNTLSLPPKFSLGYRLGKKTPNIDFF